SYRGLWDPPDAFPGRGRAGALRAARQADVHASPAAERRAADLVKAWRDAIAALVGEFAAGDARLFVDEAEWAAGPYAPLTRVHEILAPIHAASVPEGSR